MTQGVSSEPLFPDFNKQESNAALFSELLGLCQGLEQTIMSCESGQTPWLDIQGVAEVTRTLAKQLIQKYPQPSHPITYNKLNWMLSYLDDVISTVSQITHLEEEVKYSPSPQNQQFLAELTALLNSNNVKKGLPNDIEQIVNTATKLEQMHL